MKQYAAVDDTVYFWFAGNDTSGSGGDGASPAADIRLAGAAADAAPVYSPTPSLLSHVNYPAGAYEIAITASVANGFATGNTYAVFCTLAIDSQNPTGFVGSFDLKPVESNPTQLGDNAQSLTDLKDFADAGYDPGSNKITGTADMRGTDSAYTGTPPTVGEIRTEIEGVGTKLTNVLGDTNELQTNQGNWLTATGFSVPNEYNTVIAALQTDLDNPSQYMANISTLALEATLTDIKGTGFIKDTHSLPQCLTAIGFSVPNEYDTVIAALQTDLDNPTQYKADVSALATTVALATAQSDLDIITGADGVILATLQALYAPNKVVPDVAGTAAGLHTTTNALINGLDDITVADIIAGIADGIYDLQEMMRIMFAVLSGKSSGGGTATLAFRNADDDKNRLSETVDTDGNRTAVTRDGS